MVARGPGDVGCAHCTLIGATETCQVCTHLVCPACAADWSTCPQPSGRVIRLGMGGRLRDVDPIGRFAMVSYMHKGPRLLDLRQLRWSTGRFPLSLNYLNALLGKFPPRLTTDGFVVHPGFTASGGDAYNYIRGVWFHDVHGGALQQKFEDCEAPDHGTAVSSVGDLFSFVSDKQHVVVVTHQVVVPPPPPPRHVWQSPADIIAVERAWQGEHPRLVIHAHAYDPLPRQVIQQHAVDGARHLIASGTWRKLALHRFDGETLTWTSVIDTKIDGNMHWLALAGRWIAYAVASEIELRELHEDLTIGDVAHRFTGSFRTAALSSDGRHLAVARGTQLVVHDLERNRRQEFTEHTDEISYVRFAADDHVLISGDDDNRVVLRPRTDEGYAQPLIPIQLG